MFGFFQFAQPQFGDVPYISSTRHPVVGAGVMFNGDQRRKGQDEARAASVNALA